MLPTFSVSDNCPKDGDSPQDGAHPNGDDHPMDCGYPIRFMIGT